MEILKMGLTDSEVSESRKKHGENIITPPPKTPWWKLYLEKFKDPIIRILIIAAVISIIVGIVEGSFFEGIGIIIAILLATGLAFFNEFKAGKEFDLLNKVSDDTPVKVVRNGKFASIPKRDVVVGDIVLLDTGEEIPADGDILEATSLEVDESKLTGESIPAKKMLKGTGDEEKENAYPYYKLLSGTNVVSGHGVTKITEVGDHTDVAKTVRAATEEVEGDTPLTRQLDKLSKVIGIGGFTFAFMTFLSLIGLGIYNGHFELSNGQWIFLGVLFISVAILLRPVWKPIVNDFKEIVLKKDIPAKEVSWIISTITAILLFIGTLAVLITLGIVSKSPSEWSTLGVTKELLEYFMIAVTIIVVAVPEGLPMSVTLSLAYSMRKMTASNNLVRKMHACETIGAATVICTDKTGTLTMNKMRVFESKLLIKNTEYIKTIIALNSTANLEEKDGEMGVMGNPTEGALLLWINTLGENYNSIRERHSIVEQMPFSSEKKMMATIIKKDNKSMLIVKGAPEVILEKAHKYDDGEIKVFGSQKNKYHEEIISYQKRGMRTLGFGYKFIENEEKIEDNLSELIWGGFVVISDPVRDDVPDAIRMCRDAGIDVKIITGDNHLMATEIGRQIGAIDATNEHIKGTVITGTEFNEMNDTEVNKILSDIKILSRAKPLDKLRTVKMLKARGAVVAVTGDGTNDAPALNYADVGLAMGKTGTSVAKEASDIILLDDSFMSIVNAVMWGRSLYKNIQRFIIFQLTINVVAVITAFIGPFIGISLPFTVTQMLWINLIMDTFAALALATEPPNKEVMKDKPRKSEAFIITGKMAVQIFTFAGVFVSIMLYMLFSMRGQSGGELAYSQSLFFNIFVFMQIWNLLNARVFGSGISAFKGIFTNKAFMIITVAIVILQILVIQFGGAIMRTVPLSLNDWILSIVATFGVVLVGEIIRIIGNRKI